jgi:cytochrome c oxidase accessory protein FixG
MGDGGRPAMTHMDRYIIPADGAQAAPGVGRLDVSAVNRKENRLLYAGHQKIYPKLAHGRFRTIKWVVMAITLGIYYALPWLRWDRGPDLPDQAVLLDMASNRYFFFFLEIWPQEFYYITGLLVLGALSLFLVTSVAGRVWCGYSCPQTVWTDLMILVERFWQGDRNARMQLDRRPWGAAKIFKKTMTHACWLLIGMLTGGAFVFYFRDAPTLAQELLTGAAPTIAYLFLGIFTMTTSVLGGIAREQVCIYMCPWPRIQGAMVDHDTLLVGYKDYRGEPRGPHKKDQTWDNRGDCIDCRACVAVCPMGIDIRDGSQLECIQCALCIDACNDIMHKVGRPPNLIAYDTIANPGAAARGGTAPLQIIRARTLLYAGLIAVVSVIMLVVLLNRTTLEINVLHDRNPPYVMLSDGSVRNGYTIKILNKLHQPREFTLATRDLPGAQISIVGLEPGAKIRVTTDDVRELRAFVTLSKADAARGEPGNVPFFLVVKDVGSGFETSRGVNFQKPARRP